MNRFIYVLWSYRPNIFNRLASLFKRRSVKIATVTSLVAAVALIQPLSIDNSKGAARAASLDNLASLVGDFLNTAASSTPGVGGSATLTARLTGVDMQNTTRFGVGGADLGIPFQLENGSVGFLFGDTFQGRDPGSQGWRSNVMLRSAVTPSASTAIAFDSAAGLAGDGFAPELITSPHDTSGQGEFSAIPNDGVSFPENVDTGKPTQVVSYQSVRNWNNTGSQSWATNYSGLAVSYDGNTFQRVGTTWGNDGANSDPFQMVSMQRDGDYVYLLSVKAGRQYGPMMLRRVASDRILDSSAYECWNGSDWGGSCAPLLTGRFGEPSLRKLSDGTWTMAYLDLSIGSIVTRTATSPTGPWSNEKIQVTGLQLPALYGGFIHPYSTADNLTLIVSSWVGATATNPGRYDTNQFNGTLR
jgi:hypothetical protein